jgi:acetyl esterase/lipase
MALRFAWARTFVLLAIVLGVPSRLTRRAPTPEPRWNDGADGVPIRPRLGLRNGPWPAFHFVNGAHPERRQSRSCSGLRAQARAPGFVVALPDLPGLGDGELTPRTFEAASGVTRMLADRPDVRDGRVAIAGVSAGAGIALVTAADQDLSERISVVAAVVPFADIERLACLATTSRYRVNGTSRRYEVTALMRRVVARSLVAALTPNDDRSALLDLLRAQDPDDVDALLCLADPGRTLEPDAESVVALLLNEDAERFDALYRALPAEIVSRLRSFSPAEHAAAIRAPVEAIAPPDDPYFPLPEAAAIVGLVRKGSLTVTRVLDHTRPSLALSRVGDFARFLRWVSRCLGAAAG